MSNKMLIDASHPEETRVVVLRGNRVEEFDFEAADRQQLRGNIYLAKVTRVEPSLQAAFVDYGGNRHGFLAFSEIHPDYYQIPYADRQALLREQAREEREEEEAEAEAEAAAEVAADAAEHSVAEQPTSVETLAAEPAAAFADTVSVESSGPEASEQRVFEENEPVADQAIPSEAAAETDAVIGPTEVEEVEGEAFEAEAVESVGAEDALEEVPERRKPRPRQYKIQEVIKRRQVLLVQVVKEERGNKGAALTTYLSLAGRYSVLMPNTGRGGGISRKITNPADRKRLKSIASELDVPDGMGVILRTAGANRTKAEVKRDFEYLLRLWENVRELTLRSTAPKLVYEEGSLIKRSIRDLYSREIDQVVVAGEDAYREAKEFMRMLMPSHARHVQVYKDDTPIFSRNGVEAQLDAMFSPQVTLRSGGYIVINQTEALVSIDVNSGRSTREHSIEDTALNTNLEAAEEIARQLRLRDLAGLIVIDFIDMEEKRNNRAVERKLKDCLRADRARIQVGRISHFGLLEMSRQRIRTGVLESSTVACPHCRGTGQVRSISSLSLQILRALEDHLLRHSGHHLLVRTRPEVALYVLNQKRHHLAQLEGRFGLTIAVSGEAPENGAGFVVEHAGPVGDRADREPAAIVEAASESTERDREDEEEMAVEGRDRRPRRRRRRRGNGEDRYEHRQSREDVEYAAPEDTASVEEEREPRHARGPHETAESESRRRRRGRRGGRRRRGGREGAMAEDARPSSGESAGEDNFALADWREEMPVPQLQSENGGPPYESGPAGDAHAEETEALTAAMQSEGGDAEDEFAGTESGEAGAGRQPSEPTPAEFASEPTSAPEPVEDNRPKRSGWWNRRSP
jgi:ribonuclease E